MALANVDAIWNFKQKEMDRFHPSKKRSRARERAAPLSFEIRHRGRPWLDAAKWLWAAPCSAIGLLLAGVALALGGKAVWRRGALEVTYRQRHANCGKLARSLPFRGIVFGHVILAVTNEELCRIGPHERVHVKQYERWGPVFFLAYGLSSAWQLLRGRNPYWNNHFEVQAGQRSSKIHRANGSV